ncbi:hypothetical protein Hanom_Chr14g01265051 [Helianthus anomalus]
MIYSQASPKIQSAFSAETSCGSSSSSGGYSYSPSSKHHSAMIVQLHSPHSSRINHSSQNSHNPNMLKCNIVVNLQNAQGFTEAITKEHMSFLASILLLYEGLVAGNIDQRRL